MERDITVHKGVTFKKRLFLRRGDLEDLSRDGDELVVVEPRKGIGFNLFATQPLKNFGELIHEILPQAVRLSTSVASRKATNLK